MDGKSLTPQKLKLQQLKEIVPEAFAEEKVDWEKLKASLGEDINFAHERYVLNWAGKSEAFKALQAPTTKTLVPAKGESVNFDETEHIFIEGENLEVLKALQKSYFGKVKMIYIDPPYNTGNDSFIYPDKFSETKADYEKRVGDKDEEGYMTKDGMFKKNSKENGQYHSNWLNMMMPRLYLAKNLLKQDGVIFVSIDDNEAHNLRLLMNEIFGEENFVGKIVVETANGVFGTRATGLATTLVKTKDYILVYSKSNISRCFKPLYMSTKERYDTHFSILLDDKLNRSSFIQHIGQDINIKKYFNKYQLSVSLNNISTLMEIDKDFNDLIIKNYAYKIYQDVNFNLKIPDEIEKDLKSGKILKFKNHIIFRTNNGRGKTRQLLSFKDTLRKTDEYISECRRSVAIGDLWEGFDNDMKNVLKEGDVPFDSPKPIRLVYQLAKWSNVKKEDLILDFFSGSGTTAHAVMALNASDDGNRKCISVQLPELTDEKSEAYKAGYKTIADIAKERIRRSGKKIKEELDLEIKKIESEITKLESELPTDETKAKIENLKPKIEKIKDQDLGFKVLKLSESNFKQWQQITGKDKQALEAQIKLFVDPVAQHATTENMVYELLLKSGKDLNSTIVEKDGFYTINETELVLVLEKANQNIIDAVIDLKPQKIMALDKLFKGNDQLKTNSSLQMRDAGIEFKTI